MQDRLAMRRQIEVCVAAEEQRLQTAATLRHSGIIPADQVRVVSKPDLFADGYRVDLVRPGDTVQRLIEATIPEQYRDFVSVYIDDERLPGEWHARVRPKPGHQVNLICVPANISGQVFTEQNTAMFFASLVQLGAITVSNLVGGFYGGALGLGISALGLVLVNSLFGDFQQDTEDLGLSLTSLRNTANPNGAIPALHGNMRFFPIKGMQDFTEVVGDTQYLISLLVLGYGPIEIDLAQTKLGDKFLRDYLPDQADAGIRDTQAFIQYEYHEGFPGEHPGLRLVPYDVNEVREEADAGNEFTYTDPQGAGDNWIQKQTNPRASKIGIEVEFPDGLGQETDAEPGAWSVLMEVEYKPAGMLDAEWMPVTPITAEKVSDFATVLTGGSDVEETIWDYISKLQDELDDLANALSGVAGVDREMPIEIAERIFRERELAEEQAEQMEENPNFPVRVQLKQDIIDKLRNLADDVIDTFQRVALGAYSPIATVSNFLNRFNLVIDGIAAIAEVQRYVARGHGPDLEALGPLQKLMVSVWGLRPLFDPPDEDQFRIVGQTTGVRRFSMQWETGLGQYDVRMRRVQAFSSNDAVLEKGHWTVLRSIDTTTRPFERDGVALLALRIPASDEFKGSVSKVSVVGTSYARVWDGQDATQPYDQWPWQQTRNPAWQYLKVLMQPGANRNPIAVDRIDLQSFKDWADYCDGQASGDIPAYSFDQHVSRESTQQKMLNDIARAGQAVPTMRSGKYSILIDDTKTGPPTQHFTPANSHGFSSVQTYVEQIPDAVDVRFQNRESDFQKDQIRALRDGYTNTGWREREELFDGGNATIQLTHTPVFAIDEIYDTDQGVHTPNSEYTIDLQAGTITHSSTFPSGMERWRVKYRSVENKVQHTESIELVGVTDPYNAWKFGHQFRARMQLQPEQITLDADIEAIVCERGDRVLVTHSTPLWGTGYGRLTGTQDDGTNITHLELSNGVTMEAGETYVVQLRVLKDDGSGNGIVHDETHDVVNPVSSGSNTFHVIELQSGIAIGSDAEPAKGDLFLFGQQGSHTQELLVKEIRWQRNLGARLHLVHYDPAIYTAHLQPVPAFDPNVTIPPPDGGPVPPVPVIDSIVSNESVLVERAQDGALVPRLVVFLQPVEIGSGHLYPEAIELQFRPTVIDPDTGTESTDPNFASWETQPFFSIRELAPFVRPVQQGIKYDVRVRYLAEGGRGSSWVYRWGHEVIGKTSPPPDVPFLSFERFDVVRWPYPNPPIDLNGFLIRFSSDANASWEDAQPAHTGVWQNDFFLIKELTRQAKRVFVKAVDLSGNESINAAIGTIVAQSTPENIVETFQGTPNWTTADPTGIGNSTLATNVWANPQGGLEMDSPILKDKSINDSIAPNGTSESIAKSFVPADSESLFGVVTFNDATATFLPSSIKADADVVQGQAAGIFTTDINADGFDALPDSMQINQGDGDLWAIGVELKTSQGLRGEINNFTVEFDVADKDVVLEDLSIPAGGRRLNEIAGDFDKIKVINIAVQDDGGAGVSARVIDKDAVNGPNVEVLNSSDTSVAGSIDVRIKGY